MAGIGLLDVPGHESRYSAARGALRFHQQPQFRRAARARRPDASGEPHDGGSGRDRRAFYGHTGLEVSMTELFLLASSGLRFRSGLESPALSMTPTEAERQHGTIYRTSRDCGAARSRQRRHRSDHPQAVSQANREDGVRAILVL